MSTWKQSPFSSSGCLRQKSTTAIDLQRRELRLGELPQHYRLVSGRSRRQNPGLPQPSDSSSCALSSRSRPRPFFWIWGNWKPGTGSDTPCCIAHQLGAGLVGKSSDCPAGCFSHFLLGTSHLSLARGLSLTYSRVCLSEAILVDWEGQRDASWDCLSFGIYCYWLRYDFYFTRLFSSVFPPGLRSICWKTLSLK